MAEYHEYVDGIRAILQSGQLPGDGALRELADGYARACAEANERLTACLRLLNQGLRAEAIHQAETEPNLIAALTSLDFPERPHWDELAEQKGLVRSQVLNLDAARAMSKAYTEQEPLSDLLKRHRKQALAQAPLSKRLTTLRKIASKDSDSPIWREDIQKYEQARLLQLNTEADRAVLSLDAKWLKNLATELDDPQWLTPPPATLSRKVHDHLAQIYRVQARRHA